MKRGGKRIISIALDVLMSIPLLVFAGFCIFMSLREPWPYNIGMLVAAFAFIFLVGWFWHKMARHYGR